MFNEASSNLWWQWLVAGFMAMIAAVTAGVMIDEEQCKKRRVWLKLLMAISGTTGVLALTVGLVRMAVSGLAN